MNIAAHIVVCDAAEASAWYANAFGARELNRIPLPGEKVMSVELAFGGSVVHVGSEFPDMGILSPLTICATATVLQINTDDADASGPVRSTPEPGHATSSPTRSGASATGSSPTRSVTAGTSPNDSATYPRRDRRRSRRGLRQWLRPRSPLALVARDSEAGSHAEGRRRWCRISRKGGSATRAEEAHTDYGLHRPLRA